jgi:hypothetical protein
LCDFWSIEKIQRVQLTVPRAVYVNFRKELLNIASHKTFSVKQVEQHLTREKKEIIFMKSLCLNGTLRNISGRVSCNIFKLNKLVYYIINSYRIKYIYFNSLVV